MKHVLFGVFAHPDDEAFGPSGTLHKAALNGTDIHLLCLTCGDAGMNPDHDSNLAATRRHEAKAAAKLIGAQSHTCLDYKDGKLSNSLYLQLAAKIITHVTDKLREYDEPLHVEFMTLDHNGLSGHLDHIAVALTTTYAYLKLRASPPPQAQIGHLRYFCLSEHDVSAANLDWLYMPKGRGNTDIDETVDVSDVFERKLAIMHAHHSQRQDAQSIINNFGEGLKKEYFFYWKD